MDRFVIAGGRPLYGAVKVQGAKNSALPTIAACILTGEPVRLRNIPKLTDIDVMRSILHSLGAECEWEGDDLVISAEHINDCVIPENLMREMRSSIILLGPLLARAGRVVASYPGGCAIGSRPIDLHLKGLRALGVQIEDEGSGLLRAHAETLRGADIHLSLPSVGATENIMMAATVATGETIIRNAAMEPEIVDLQNLLNAMGADISGAGTDCLSIRGVTRLHGTEYTIIPDRIVAGTYLLGAVMTRGHVTVFPAPADQMEPLLARLREMGALVVIDGSSVTAVGRGRPKALESVKTSPFPGFPTDLQAQLLAALCLADGTSVLTETVFESRFKHVDELNRLGASIKVSGRNAVIRGVGRLTGAQVSASDLRAGAALTLAGLAAQGITIVDEVHHIGRGYANIVEDLRTLGAAIERI
ncbi:MAG: UDP-N-acetylglucosamine 1-carboxyvinyltransferase 1 [Firmicutes bacterium]|nr:UDP-N-acetylglucosamine 1-carboxyvinyltransferase 1 [candidate division NPL-UPA2 bacterium]